MMEPIFNCGLFEMLRATSFIGEYPEVITSVLVLEMVTLTAGTKVQSVIDISWSFFIKYLTKDTP